MRNAIRLAAAVVAITGLALTGRASAATAQRTFVGSTGVDTNACSITAPCRGFAAAVAATSAGGEVIVLDSAGYGPVTITKSISLIAPTGVYAGVTVFTGDGITINAPGIIAVLHGLAINGQGGANGIGFRQGAGLRVENCIISNMIASGIVQDVSAAEMIVLDTIVRDNGSGIVISAGSAVLDQVRSEHNAFDGLSLLPLSAGASLTISASLFAFNGRHGISVASGTPTSIPRVQVDRSVLANNSANGYFVDGANALSYSVLTRNAIHRNGGEGARVFGGGAGNYVTMSENAISGNAAGIRSELLAAYVWAGANTFAIPELAFVQANGAFLGTLGNNLGGGNSGSISSVGGN